MLLISAKQPSEKNFVIISKVWKHQKFQVVTHNVNCQNLILVFSKQLKMHVIYATIQINTSPFQRLVRVRYIRQNGDPSTSSLRLRFRIRDEKEVQKRVRERASEIARSVNWRLCSAASSPALYVANLFIPLLVLQNLWPSADPTRRVIGTFAYFFSRFLLPAFSFLWLYVCCKAISFALFTAQTCFCRSLVLCLFY